MKYILFEAGPVTVYSYGLMIALGVITDLCCGTEESEKLRIRPGCDFLYGSLGIAGGNSRGKAVVLSDRDQGDHQRSIVAAECIRRICRIWRIIGGILGAYIYAKIKKIDILAYFDLAVPSIAFAQGFGRIGCFLAGCCYGRETNAWYGITFHNSPFAPNEVALIPTQLISSVADFAHFLS